MVRSVVMLLLAACSRGDDSQPTHSEHSDSTGSDSASHSEDSGPQDPRVSLGEPLPCASPLSSPSYTEVGELWGLPAGPPEGDHLDGGGVAIDDLNGDGLLDLVLTYENQPLDIFMGAAGGTFTSYRLGGKGGPPMLVDVDGDGDRDLIIGGESAALYINEGGELREQGPMFKHAEGASRQPGVADLDGDGDLDLYVPATAPNSYEAHEDFLLWNDGQGNFEADMDSLDDSKTHRKGFQGLVMDWEDDGDPDIYVGNDMGDQWGGNVLWENKSGTLTDASDACSCGLVQKGMGGDIGDFNRDGLPDIYLAATGTNSLLASVGQGIYVDVTTATGATPFAEELEMAWGAVWLDYDNDGWLDIAVAQGDLWAAGHPGQVQNRSINLMRQQDGHFSDVASTLGMDTEGSWRALAAADFNTDGLLDLVVTDVVKRPYIYLSDGCTTNAWLVVEAPIGSRVEVSAGGATQVDWVSPQSGFGATGPLELWFGLGEHNSVDDLRIILPWSSEEIRYDGPFDARRRVQVSP